MLSELPSAVVDAVTGLQQRGFVTRSDVLGGMAGRELVLEGQIIGRTVGVRVIGDRGTWTLAIQVGPDGPWLPPYLWSAELTHRPIEGPRLADDAKFLVERLGDVVLAVEQDAGLPDVLTERGREYMAQRLGLG